MEIIDLGYEYCIINTHRTEISAFHKPIEDFLVGKHPKVHNLMTGVMMKDPQNQGAAFCGILKQS